VHGLEDEVGQEEEKKEKDMEGEFWGTVSGRADEEHTPPLSAFTHPFLLEVQQRCLKLWDAVPPAHGCAAPPEGTSAGTSATANRPNAPRLRVALDNLLSFRHDEQGLWHLRTKRRQRDSWPSSVAAHTRSETRTGTHTLQTLTFRLGSAAQARQVSILLEHFLSANPDSLKPALTDAPLHVPPVITTPPILQDGVVAAMDAREKQLEGRLFFG
jgi:hypothetical protein